MSPETETRETWYEPQANRRPFLQSPPEGKLVSVSMPAPGLKISAFLANSAGQERFFWGAPNDDILFAGFGVAVQMMAWGAGRFQEIERKARSIFAEALISSDESPLAKPRFFGGFAFRDDFTPDNTWSVFHPAHFFLPHLQLVQAGSESWLTLNAMLPPEEDPRNNLLQLREALAARLLELQDLNHVNEKRISASFTRNFPLSFNDWSGILQRAIQMMKQGELNKVVLSRVCEIRFRKVLDINEPLAYINENYRDSTRFIFEPKPFHVFFGATPERLVRVEGQEIQTIALAGSSPRGVTAVEDQENASILFNSEKDRREHDLVVGSIRRRLEPYVSDLNIPPRPSVLKLSYIHHLSTSITGCLTKAEGVLPMVERLHPTPALGGSPRDMAMDFISENEPVPRGWYAGPIGWVDSQMDGEFVVAIRSAVTQRNRVWLYAGAGIVEGSDANQEWVETEMKFRPMYEALGLIPENMEQPIK